MAHMRMLTPEASPEPETRPSASGLWQPKSSTTTNTTATQQPLQKRKRSWPFTTTRPVSPPSSTTPLGDDGRPSSTTTTSVKALWEENGWWRTAARRGLAPFQDANLEEDLQPIFETLIASGVDDITSPEYTLAFYPRAHELALHAENALLHHGDRALAAQLYLRAAALLRVGRYSPRSSWSSAEATSTQQPHCPVRARAWQLQKSYHLKAGRLHPESPMDEVTIPHTHDAASRPDDTTAGVRERGSIAAAAKSASSSRPARPQIPLVVRLPPRTLRTGTPCPAVLVVTDDRTSHSGLCGDLLARGWGCVVVEAPGCGDCPVPAESADTAALWASVLEWMGAIRVFDMARVVVWADADAAGADDAPGLVGQFAAALGGARVCGCVAVVGGGGSAVMAAGGDGGWGSKGRVLVVADDDGAGATYHEGAGVDGLVLFEYGATGVRAEQAVRSLAASSVAVYDWMEDLLFV